MISETLKKARKERKLTQQGLADRSGVGREKIAAYEAGKLVPSEETLDKLAGHLALPLSKLKAAIAPERDAKRKRKENSFEKFINKSARSLDEKQKELLKALVEDMVERNQKKASAGQPSHV